jgi:hypothetical protein
MSLWKRTTKRLVHMQHAHDAGGIKIVTLHKFTMEPTKEYIIQPRRLQRVKNTNVLKRPEDNDGVHNPAQAKPEG